MEKNRSINLLNQAGQSIWYDNLSRDVLNSGELQRHVEAGVSGLTSNPAIFKKAIADSSSYDVSIRELKSSGLDAEAICEELMVQDVGAAADLLKPVYDRTGGEDGFASIEVSPYLASDPAATIEAAGRLYRKLNRPNIMIKIPGTGECLPAIFEVLKGGINVNVTLLFSVDNYLSVTERYMKALEVRESLGAGNNSVRSVASFFVSRVDTICDQKFDEVLKAGRAREKDRNLFLAKAGIANALIAYEAFESNFGSARFLNLKASGSRVQKPLWASTGTKNQQFSPLLYVEGLCRPQTVNTVPPQTLEAILNNEVSADRSHGVQPRAVMSALSDLGLDFEGMMKELQVQGVRLFADAYTELLKAVDSKIRKVAG